MPNTQSSEGDKPGQIVTPVTLMALALVIPGTFVLVWLFAVAYIQGQITPAVIYAILATFFFLTGVMLSYTLIQRLIKAHEEEASRLNAILNSIADGVIVQGLDGKIETMNPSAQEIIDTISNSSSRRVSAKDLEVQRAQAEAKLNSLLTYLAGLDFDERQNIEVGGRVLGTRSAPVVIPEGERFGSVFVLRDITTEVQATKLKDDFITTISHELRTPLAVIKGYNDLLRMRVSAIEENQRASFLQNVDNVEKNIEDLLNQIEQMLDLTQINAGQLGIDREKFEVVAVLRDQAGRWQDQMAEKGLEFSFDLPADPIQIVGDQARLERVIHQLLTNAFHYTLPGGSVALTCQSQPEQVLVEVKDTGVGIPQRDQPLIFNRFFRAIHQEQSFEVSGSGLGLFLSKAIVEAHGGEMWFESVVNQGSTFSFTLPLLDPLGGQPG
ncbi:MAG: PAS domain-containing sensor histidine kinase [Anaerolineae bacterium]|nr:PAS domain-containing sensor histidine kinase [Anaerolineae bacterium]